MPATALVRVMVPPVESKVPPLAPSVMPRLLLKFKLPVERIPPPFRVIWSATNEAGLAPKALSPEVATNPVLMVVLPV